jgi:Domain of unknown function (DUF1707)
MSKVVVVPSSPDRPTPFADRRGRRTTLSMPAPGVRAGDAERTAASERLAAHAAAGRLTVEELESRLERVNAAVYGGELREVEADLPSSAPARRPPGARPPVLPLVACAAVLMALFVASTTAVGHPVFPPVFVVLLIWLAARGRWRLASWRPPAPRVS